jgi:hypothetical protein
MRRLFRGIILSAALVLSLAGPGALAQETPAPATPAPATAPATPAVVPAPSEPVAPDNSILNFIKANPACTQITDECIICAVVSGKAMCSTPGISCIRKDVRCVTTEPPTPKQ